MNRERLINTLLVLGVFIGISLALFSSIRDTNFDDSRDWAARVGGAEISKEKYLLQLDGLNSDKRVPLNKEDKAFVLERMIEEELLIQRAKDLGLFSTNTMIRGTVVQQMINMIISENFLDIVSNSELELFYKNNKGFFTNADRLRLKQIYFSEEKGSALKKAENLYLELIKGKSIYEIDGEGDKSALEIPDVLLTLAKVREYIGPSLMQVAKMLQPGEFTTARPTPVLNQIEGLILLRKK